jgi:hypothetical protein
MVREMEDGRAKPKPAWMDLARALSEEHDPKKALELAAQLNEAMLAEEKDKARKRVRRVSSDDDGSAG